MFPANSVKNYLTVKKIKFTKRERESIADVAI